MYVVSREMHHSYGPLVSIERDANGSAKTPFQAVQCACKEARLLREAGAKKVRVLIDDKIMTLKQAEQWSDKEYKSLPKCSYCAKIMEEDVFTHRLSSDLFCSQLCADRDYSERIDKLKDEEDCECL
jgi:hypothetical protein